MIEDAIKIQLEKAKEELINLEETIHATEEILDFYKEQRHSYYRRIKLSSGQAHLFLRDNPQYKKNIKYVDSREGGIYREDVFFEMLRLEISEDEFVRIAKEIGRAGYIQIDLLNWKRYYEDEKDQLD